MLTQAEQFAAVFDRLGREVLAQLDSLPVSALHWPLPLPQGDSLFTRALRLIEESAFWVLEVIGGQDVSHDGQRGVPEKRSLISLYVTSNGS